MSARADSVTEQVFDRRRSHLACIAAFRDDCDELARLLQLGLDLNAPLDRSPLMCAAEHGHTAAVRFLLERKADVGQCSAFRGFAALHIASTEGHFGVVELLIESGADVNQAAQGERAEWRGMTPLGVCAWSRKPPDNVASCAKLLLQHKCDPSLPADRSALQLARANSDFNPTAKSVANQIELATLPDPAPPAPPAPFPGRD